MGILSAKLNNFPDAEITVLALTDPTGTDVQVNNALEQYLVSGSGGNYSGLGQFADLARRWNAANPAQAFSGISRDEALSAIYQVVRDNNVAYVTMNTHGDGHGFLLAPGADGSETGVTFETLASYVAKGVSDGAGNRRLVFSFNQCGGKPIADKFLSAMQAAYSEYVVPLEGRPEIYVEVSSVHSTQAFPRVSLPDMPLARLAMALNGGGLVDPLWGEANAASQQSYSPPAEGGPFGIGAFSGYVFQGLPGDGGMDLEVRTYRMGTDGAVSEVAPGNEVLVQPLLVGSYSPAPAPVSP